MTLGDMYLYNWVFRFNPHDNKWHAAKRDNYSELFNNIKSENVLKSSDINTLIYLIKRTNGDKSKLKQIVK